MFPRVLVVQMGYHKTLPTPKVTSQDWYYSRKLRTHLLGVYVANEDCLHCYFYDDTVAGAGPNEVISLLHSTLTKLTEQYGTFDQLIVWTDNAPSQFKECFFFFYLDHLVKNKYFLRIDLKFLVEGHSYSICDRRFGSIQQFFDTHEKVEVPQEWATLLKNSDLKNIKVHWITSEVIMDYKSFLKMHYVSRNVDTEGNKFEVKKIAWINYGYGEVADERGNLKLVRHDGAFVRFKVDAMEKPTSVSFSKKKQGVQLKPDMLSPVNLDKRLVPLKVKQDCEKLAQKYLSEAAKRFYAAMSCSDEDATDD